MCFMRCLCLPNDHVIFVDDASQGAVFNGKAVAYDDTGSAFMAVERNTKHTPTVQMWHFYVYLLHP